jgi:hypothetical protein
MLTVLPCVFGRVCAAHAKGHDEWYDCTRLVATACAEEDAGAAAEAKQPTEPPLPLPEP